MNMNLRSLIGSIVPLLALAGFAAPGPDSRLADAVEKKDKAAVRALLKQRIDVNVPQPDGTTALA